MLEKVSSLRKRIISDREIGQEEIERLWQEKRLADTDSYLKWKKSEPDA